jgi:uncharacterized protein YggE
MARVELAIANEGPSVQEAVEDNRRRSRALAEALAAIVGHGRVETGPVSVRRPYAGRTTEEARSSVRAEVGDISLLVRVLDLARAHATDASQTDVVFTRRDPRALRAQAIAEATRRAREDAETAARSLGVAIARAPVLDLKVSEGRLTVRVTGEALRASSDARVPLDVRAREHAVSVTAQVTLSVAITDS